MLLEAVQKIVIDTNVIISSLIQRSYPYKIIQHILFEDDLRFCLSEMLMAEYYEVISRPKFSQFQDFLTRAEMLLAAIESKATKFTPTIKLDLISDVNDNKILELADECSADFIITGNTNDFTFPIYKSTRIVTPREYWEELIMG